jgi:hypothetical protein
MDSFYNKLKEFHPYEIKAAKLIEAKYRTKIFKYCNDNRYDFKTEDKMKYEVKTEPTSLITGNFFIEFYGYNKSSGITVSKSNYYFINDTIKYYLIPTNKLREIIAMNTFRIVSTKDKMTYGYLINKNIIVEQSIILN